MSAPRGPADLVVERLDVHDDAALGPWYAVQAASQRHGREETAAVWTLPELVHLLREDTGRRTRVALSARSAGEVVGTATVVASLVDNLDAAEVGVDVRPDRRGEGIGAALRAAAADVARGLSRTLLQSEVAWPYDSDPTGADSRDLRWARVHGFALGIVDVQRRLDLPVDPALLDRLAAEAAPHHATYDVRAWTGPVPDALVDGWAALLSTLMTEAPAGEMTREDEALDAEAIRLGEALAQEQGRTRHNAVALAADGTVAACSDIVTSVHEPGRAYQWGTLVRRDHRGHRLGLALKVANLQHLARTRPDLTSVRTWNAEVNAHMVGVNERLGFVPTERLAELEKRLG